jgi:hypothetical protein
MTITIADYGYTAKALSKWNMLCTLSSICNIELTHQNNSIDVDIYHLVTLFCLRTNSLFLLYSVMVLAQLSRRIYKFIIFWSKTRGQICLLTYEFCLSLWKIARCSVILLLHLFSWEQKRSIQIPKDFRLSCLPFWSQASHSNFMKQRS